MAGTVEQTVARVWAQVLGTDVDAESDFFLLGGHSMLATRMIALLANDLGVRVTLRELLDHPVLGEFVELVEQRHQVASR